MDLSLHLEERTAFRRIDWSLIIIIFCLNFIGLINLYSATHGPNSKEVETLFHESNHLALRWLEYLFHDYGGGLRHCQPLGLRYLRL